MNGYERLANGTMKSWLMERVEMIPFSGCWIFMGAVSGDGRARVYVGGGSKNAVYALVHRLMFEAEHGEIPEGLCVCHKCDVPSCCNPDHLFLGTHGDNMRDAARKGRMTGPAEPARGERHGNAKLTRGQVGEIRSRYADGGVYQRELAEEYGVSQLHISRVVRNEAWRDM